MARQRRRFSSGGGKRRKVTWTAGPEGTLSIATTANTAFATGIEAVSPDLTIVRTRGELLLFLQTASVALSGMQYAFGICTVFQNAAGIGVTAIPGPLTDIAWDGWFFHHQGALKAPTTTISNDLGGMVDRVTIDSKAMRKIHATDTTVGVIETVETVSAIMHAELRSRLLVMLP